MCVERRGLGEQHASRFTAVERHDVDALLFHLSRRNEKQHPPAIGQELWPAVPALSPSASCVSGIGAPPKAATDYQCPTPKRREYDHIVVVPGAPPALRRVGEHLWRPAGEVDSLQLGVGKEADGAAVGRPERVARSRSSGKRLRDDLIQPPHPELSTALDVGQRTPSAGRPAMSSNENASLVGDVVTSSRVTTRAGASGCR